MTNEQLRMQMLSGIITESQYKQKLEENKSPKSKKSLKENFVGIGMVGNIFDREKTDYELAFEHFTKESLSENEEMEKDLNEDLKNDDYIYSNLLEMDHEQLISTMMSTAEENPSITLEDFLNQYSYAGDEDENED